jgi:hypothetical protein
MVRGEKLGSAAERAAEIFGSSAVVHLTSNL